MSRFTIVLLLCSLFFSSIAQKKIEGIPLSFTKEFQARFSNEIPTTSIKISDLEKQKKSAEDLRSVSLPIKTDISLSSDGEWIDLPNGNRLWRLKIQSSNAEGIAILYDNFYLPRGSKLFVYSEDRKQILGAYTQQNNSKSQRFITGILNGDHAIIEYYEPAAVKGKGNFRIFRVDHIYDKKVPSSNHPFQQTSSSRFGFASSRKCQSDIVCSEGLGFDVIKRGVCRIMMVLEEGIGWCTGNLMNTTAQDGRPIILSAYHCYHGYTPMFDMWRFDFNYETKFCGQDQFEPNFQSVLGCELRSFWEDTDFLLLELNQNIPENYNAYFNGWDYNGETLPANATLIHHPSADVKKLTIDTDQPIIFGSSINWNNGIRTPANHHFRVTQDEGGGFETGSSGGALFNGNKRIVGQLHGGWPDTLCRVSTAYFGRLHLSWEGGGTPESRLRDWLDPLGTGDVRINGIENPDIDEVANVQGQIMTPDSTGVSGVDILVDGEVMAETDLAGNYLIENLSVGTNYEIQPSKNINPINGTSVQDLIIIQKHNLNREPFTSLYDIIASDINNSKSISVIDLIELNKVILGRSTAFPNNTSWRFMPTTFDTQSVDITNFDFVFPESVELQVRATNDRINFTGIKIGDVNDSVNASE
ncbi:MAG: hypothetical protein AAF806_22920 [Bacteroidota bacterium]